MDSILNGGIPIGFLTEICGLAGSGKSQLCMQLAINCVMSSNSSVLYIDTKQDFSAVRIQKTLEAYGLSHKVSIYIFINIYPLYVHGSALLSYWKLEVVVVVLTIYYQLNNFIYRTWLL